MVLTERAAQERAGDAAPHFPAVQRDWTLDELRANNARYLAWVRPQMAIVEEERRERRRVAQVAIDMMEPGPGRDALAFLSGLIVRGDRHRDD